MKLETLAVSLLPVLFGFLGVLIGAQVSLRRDRDDRRFSFIRQQLEELYAPLLTRCEEIRARNALKERISMEADASWRALFEGITDPETKQKIMDREKAKYENAINYDNNQLMREILPAYKEMLDRLRRGLWLAEPSTRDLFRPLYEFIDIWDRWNNQALPADVLARLNHGGEVLEQIRGDAEVEVRALRDALRGRR